MCNGQTFIRSSYVTDGGIGRRPLGPSSAAPKPVMKGGGQSESVVAQNASYQENKSHRKATQPFSSTNEQGYWGFTAGIT